MIKIQKNIIEINDDVKYKIHCYVTIDSPTPSTIKSRRETFLNEDLKAWNGVFKKLQFPIIEHVTFLKQIKNKESENIDYLFNGKEFIFMIN